MSKAYLFGQVLGTHSFYLRKGFPVAGEYSEIEEKYFLPGGETGTCATVLDSLGVNVKIDGTHIGTEVAPMLKDFYKNKNVDLSSLFFDPDYSGLMDYVLISGLERTPMGMFQQLYEKKIKRWNMPKEKDIIESGFPPLPRDDEHLFIPVGRYSLLQTVPAVSEGELSRHILPFSASRQEGTVYVRFIKENELECVMQLFFPE